MFTPQTEAALAANIGVEYGQPWSVALSADEYRELVFAARRWDALVSGSTSNGPTLRFVQQADGSFAIKP